MNEKLFLKLAAMQQPVAIAFNDAISDAVDIVNLARGGQKVQLLCENGRAPEDMVARLKRAIVDLSVSPEEFTLDERKTEIGLLIVVASSKPCVSPSSHVLPEDRKALYDRLVSDLDGMTVRAANCLEFAKIRYVGELVQKTEADIFAYRKGGQWTLNAVEYALKCVGLSLGMNTLGWVPPKPT